METNTDTDCLEMLIDAGYRMMRPIDKIETLEKNLGKDKEVVVKSTILKISTNEVKLFGITVWRRKKK